MPPVSVASANLPDPTIKLPNKHFDTALYTGNGSTGQSISTLQFQPDFLWFKTRSDNRNHVVNDSVRGRAKGSYPDDTSAEFTDDAGRGLASFDANGFTVGEPQNASSHNKNGETIVTWAWNAGTSTVTNDDGDISSQVRANTTAGFSIVSYTGTGSAGDTVGHGLGVKPDVIITKRRNTSSNWGVYHQAITADKSLFLNLTNAEIDNSVYYNDTEPTSTVFTLGGSNESNGGNGDTYIAYCFSEVAGYSKFGKYTGNGNTNGTFVFTNFRPAVIILKRINSSASWVIHDNKRAGYNGDNDYLHPDNQQAESDGSSGTLDILSNGFKLRMTAGTHNGSGDSYIYLCFAESPFKNARAR